MKRLLANTLGKLFKSIRICGALRFKILYLVYRCWPGLHIRHKEWDFVLEYLPKLHSKKQNVKVLDVGCSRTLFIHELRSRGYNTWGIDLEEHQDCIDKFLIGDITKFNIRDEYDFITCISVLEHIGNNGNGDISKQKQAITNMMNALKPDGRLLLTIPTKEFAIDHPWHGFSYKDLSSIFNDKLHLIIENTEKAGQICLVAVKL